MPVTRHLALFTAALLAAGCSVDSGQGSLRQQLGLGGDTPDEFLIIARNPIEVPASLDLPRPTPGAPSRVEVDPVGDAHATLFQRREPVRLQSSSQGERVLLAGADADGDLGDVRGLISSEEQPAGERQFGLDNFFGVPIPNSLQDLDSAVDKIEEQEELRERGLPVPAAPPPPENRETGIRFIEG